MNRFKPNQTVRINDTQSEYHKCLACVVKVGTKSYDVAVGPTTMRVVPEQLLGVRKPCRRKSQEELDAILQAEAERNAEKYRIRSECGHYNCAPSEWYWSGQIRVMRCNECGEEDYREEEL